MKAIELKKKGVEELKNKIVGIADDLLNKSTEIYNIIDRYKFNDKELRDLLIESGGNLVKTAGNLLTIHDKLSAREGEDES